MKPPELAYYVLDDPATFRQEYQHGIQSGLMKKFPGLSGDWGVQDILTDQTVQIVPTQGKANLIAIWRNHNPRDRGYYRVKEIKDGDTYINRKGEEVIYHRKDTEPSSGNAS